MSKFSLSLFAYSYIYDIIIVEKLCQYSKSAQLYPKLEIPPLNKTKTGRKTAFDASTFLPFHA